METNEANINFVNWKCYTCFTQVKEVQTGVSSAGHFVARWICPNCQIEVVAAVPIAQYMAIAPLAPEEEEAKKAKEAQLDLVWLHEMKIGGDLNLDIVE
jgi:hypothetical protein